jgi:putative transposase
MPRSPLPSIDRTTLGAYPSLSLAAFAGKWFIYIVATGVNSDDRWEILRMEIGTSEAKPIWTAFLRKLTLRGLRGVKLVVSDAHEVIKAAVSKVLCASWQRCHVRFMRNVLAHTGKSGRRVVSAFIATAFAQEAPEATSAQWRTVADQIRPKVPKLAAIIYEAEPDVLAYMTFPREHRAKLHSTTPPLADRGWHEEPIHGARITLGERRLRVLKRQTPR